MSPSTHPHTHTHASIYRPSHRLASFTTTRRTYPHFLQLYLLVGFNVLHRFFSHFSHSSLFFPLSSLILTHIQHTFCDFPLPPPLFTHIHLRSSRSFITTQSSFLLVLSPKSFCIEMNTTVDSTKFFLGNEDYLTQPYSVTPSSFTGTAKVEAFPDTPVIYNHQCKTSKSSSNA